MVRAPCCDKMGLKKGPWTEEEDQILVSYIQRFGHGNWRALPKQAGLVRCGKSCRLRWMNYLRPDIKRGNFSSEEEEAIITLHELLGNRWSAIAARLPGRTDNEIKNVWHTHLKKRVRPSPATLEQRKEAAARPCGATAELGSEPGLVPASPSSPSPSCSDFSSTSTDCSNTTTVTKGASTERSFPDIDESFWCDALSWDHSVAPTCVSESGCIPSNRAVEEEFHMSTFPQEDDVDFCNNVRNIKESISRAKEFGAVIRVGPELEITGYGCEDHFLEHDTVSHSWECLKDILLGDWTEGILCSIGMPIIHQSVRYNCQVFCLNRRILMIRPKMCLANDGNYREFRWFSAWTMKDDLMDFQLPHDVAQALSQDTVPFGFGYIQFMDVAIAAETCEELFTANAPRIALALNGVEVFTNASGSHHQLRKLNLRIDAIRSATLFCGGVYLYSNHQGCDGGRLYYDGCSCIAINGDVVAQGSQFSLKDVEVLTAQVDLDAVASYRGSISSFREQASHKSKVPSVKVAHKLCESFNLQTFPTCPIKIRYHCPEEEIAFGPSCWLWDYLRRSGASGFLLPLSGGADSSSVAAIVGCMCQLVVKDVVNGDEQVKADAIRIGQYKNGEFPTDSKEFAKRIFYTVYMGTENSSYATRSRAKKLADEIGSWHLDVPIDSVIAALLSLFQTLTGKRPRYKVDGGSDTENLGLQNIQARVRMVLAFMLASLAPWVQNKSGFFLVLGSSNVDEALRGYLTKYDCSSADINPIGSVSKQDLRAFLRWAAAHLGYFSLEEIEAAPPTAELEPIRSNYNQLDEVDMGMTYEELSAYGRLRKIFRCGPVSMFQNLCHKWCGRLTPSEVADKVKHFFKYYSINRHKMTVLTPSYHAESYSPEDNRFDLRQFLYNSRWPFQFRKIDELARGLQSKQAVPPVSASPEYASNQGSGMGVIAAGSENPSAGL